MTVADSAGVTTGTAADTLVAPLDDLPAVEQLFALHGNDIAAVIIEPLPANNGLLPQREGYLQQLLEIAHAYNALVIFDEVITGFRLAFGGAAAFYDVTPDLVTYGKIIGGGFPVGAFGGRADLMDQVAPVGPVYQAGTLSGNPVAMAAGLAALRKLLRNKPWDTLAGRNAALCRNIQAIPANKRHPDEIRLNCVAVASLFWISVGAAASGEAVVRTQHQVSPVQKNLFPALFHGLLDRGHYLSPSAFESGFLSTSHDDSDLDNFVQATADTLAQLDGAE
jgi:glutamate-1-semialdehyde 2,1-aminomutase